MQGGIGGGRGFPKEMVPSAETAMGMALSVSVDLQEETPPGWDRSRCPGCQGRRPGRRRRGLGVGKAVQPRARSDWTPRAPRPGRRRSATPTERYQRSSADRGRQTELACLFLYRGLIGSWRASIPAVRPSKDCWLASGQQGRRVCLASISRRWAVFPKLADRVELASASLPSNKLRALDWHQLQVEARVVVQRELDKGSSASLEGIGGLIIGSARPPLPGMLGYSH